MKRLARYLKRERQRGQVIDYGKMAEELGSIHGLGLGRLQGNPKVIKCRRSDAGRTHFESIHTKTEGHRKEQCSSRTVAPALGASEAKGVQSMMRDLGIQC